MWGGASDVVKYPKFRRYQFVGFGFGYRSTWFICKTHILKLLLLFLTNEVQVCQTFAMQGVEIWYHLIFYLVINGMWP